MSNPEHVQPCSNLFTASAKQSYVAGITNKNMEYLPLSPNAVSSSNKSIATSYKCQSSLITRLLP